ncbi:MAG: carboxypeptidase-like regulatory domain-containing protein [Bryobacteraceae bacterium]
MTGQLTDPRAKPVAGATVRLKSPQRLEPLQTSSDTDGHYALAAPPGAYKLTVSAPGLEDVTRTITVKPGETLQYDVEFARLAARNEAITVTADVTTADIENPDPAQRIFIRQQILDANPGRPGVPISIPGLPAETPAGGIKAPQYFAPGVAGDH